MSDNQPTRTTEALGTKLLTACWILAGASAIIVFVRVLTQRKLKGHFEANDYTMAVAQALSLAGGGLLTAAIKSGFSAREPDNKSMEYAFLAVQVYFSSLALGRAACALFLLNFVGSSRRVRHLLWFLAVSQVLFHAGIVLQNHLQCTPIKALWVSNIEGECWDFHIQVYLAFATGSFNSLTDLLLTIVPIWIVSRLKMSLGLKVILGNVLGLSIFAMATSIIKTTKVNPKEKPYYMYDISYVLWLVIENHIVIIAGSLPKVWPLYVAWRKNRSERHNRVQPNTSDPSRRIPARDTPAIELSPVKTPIS